MDSGVFQNKLNSPGHKGIHPKETWVVRMNIFHENQMEKVRVIRPMPMTLALTLQHAGDARLAKIAPTV